MPLHLSKYLSYDVVVVDRKMHVVSNQSKWLYCISLHRIQYHSTFSLSQKKHRSRCDVDVTHNTISK